MKKIVRIMGRNDVIYEELMTEAQLQQFLRLVACETSVGVAFQEWTIEIVDDRQEQRLKQASFILYFSGCTNNQ